MNDFQKTLYANLMALCSPEQEAFYFVDQKCLHTDKDWNQGDVLFRIFLYRLASYTEFQKPGALECRGHTFRIDREGNPLEFVSMPMQKFFNLDENPFVMGLDLSEVDRIADKLDGSLISSVKVFDDVILKSKGSLNSTQAQDATKLLYTPEYAPLLDAVTRMAKVGYTVNMEYMAPDNRIVIGYAKPTLKILNVRDNYSGQYVDDETVAAYDKLDEKFFAASHPIPADPHSWAYSVAEMLDDIEGFVVKLKSGVWFKLKTDKYKALHHTKDSITVPRRLFETCVRGGADDLRSMFSTDPLAVSQIDEMMEKVSKIYNHIHMTVHGFYNLHKDAYGETDNPRKYYAIAAQKDAEIQKMGIFGLVMNLYLGKEAEVEEFMVKNYKAYGIKDEAPAEVAE